MAVGVAVVVIGVAVAVVVIGFRRRTADSRRRLDVAVPGIGRAGPAALHRWVLPLGHGDVKVRLAGRTGDIDVVAWEVRRGGGQESGTQLTVGATARSPHPLPTMRLPAREARTFLTDARWSDEGPPDDPMQRATGPRDPAFRAVVADRTVADLLVRHARAHLSVDGGEVQVWAEGWEGPTTSVLAVHATLVALAVDLRRAMTAAVGTD